MRKITLKNKNESGKTCAILSYFLIGIICYVLNEKLKRNSLAKFHAKQGVILFFAIVIVNVINVFSNLLGWITGAVLFVLSILGMLNAIDGKEEGIPLLGKLSNYFKF